MNSNYQSHTDWSRHTRPSDHLGAFIESDVLITHTLAARPTRPLDFAFEHNALQTLAQQLAREPQTLLKALVTEVQRHCRADTAGISVLETFPDGTTAFRWVAIAGTLEHLEQTTVPQGYSPCGTASRLEKPQLYAHPERYFHYLQQLQDPIAELLVFPLRANYKTLGTVWVISHTQQQRFGPEDQQILTVLSGYATAALQSLSSNQSGHAVHRQSLTANAPNAIAQMGDRSAIELEIQRLVFLANNSTEFVGMCDLNLNLFYINAVGRQMIGLDETTDLDEISFRDCFFPEDQGFIVHEFLPRVLRDGQAETEMRFRHIKTEEPLWMILNVFQIKGENSLPIGLATISRNITERKQTEFALRESESRLRLMIESAKEYAIFTLDLNGIITGWNAGAERLLGYAESEAVGCNGRIIFTPEDRRESRFEREMQVALMQGWAENECLYMRKDDSCFWASGLMIPLQDEVNGVQGFVKVLQDKTAQRQATERFQLLYDTTSDLLATEQPLALMHNLFRKLSAQLELHCYCNFILEEKNDRLMLHLKDYAGLSNEEACAVEWIELGQYLCGQVAQQRRQIALGQTQLESQSEIDSVYLSEIKAYAGQPLIARGRLLGTLAFASRTRTHFDPPDLELLQSTCDQMAIAIDRANLLTSIRQQTEQLKQMNRIKDEFLAVLSHELRSPLNPILGWSKLLKHGKLDHAKTVEALNTIERNARLQSQLIEDLLDVSQILQGKLRLTISSVDLAATIRTAVETVELAADAKSIHLNVNLDPSVGFVAGDANRLQQVIWNLLSNAIKFTSPGGRVEVTLERIESLMQASNASEPCPLHYAQITVSDSGRGISAAFLPHVFDYFRQADSSATRLFGGLGMGLAIAHYLVELHGGTIRAESPGEGRGATFVVTIPTIPSSTELSEVVP